MLHDGIRLENAAEKFAWAVRQLREDKKFERAHAREFR
ncbi:hypothetical protein J2X67_001627 [Variovorax sp. 3319]|nr:hypothetical protein [Variovorax sp. 3319]